MKADLPVISVRSLSHRYETDWALKDVSFEVQSGCVYGLLGSNGAGKSTLMNILCGVLSQTDGEVYVCGVNVKTRPLEVRALIGFLPQQAPLYLDLTVTEYLAHCARFRGIPIERQKKSVERAMERCGVAHFRRRLLGNLSGGYRQRVGIAQAIVHEPRLVVLDEPTTGLDPNQILAVRNLISDISKENTVLVSSHILPEISATCEKLIMIEHGSEVFKGSMIEFEEYLITEKLVLYSKDEGILDIMQRYANISKVEKIGAGRYEVVVNGDSSKACIDLIRLCSESGIGLVEIYRVKASLEDVFAALSMPIAEGGR